MIYFELVLILILGFILDNLPEGSVLARKKRAIYIITCLILFWLLAALRNVDWVASMHLDARGYASSFKYTRMIPWSSLITSFQSRYLLRLGDSDIGYDILSKIVGTFTDDYNVFSLFVDLLFFIPFGLLLYKYTTKVRHLMFAFIFYVALVQVHMISGARQMLALGIDIIAVMLALEDKKKASIIMVLVGVTIHFSSIIVFLPLLLMYFDVKPIVLKRLHVASFVAFPIVFLFPNQIIRFLGNVVGIEKYSNYGASAVQGGANTFILLLGVLSVFSFFAIHSWDLEENVNIRRLYAMVPLMTVFGPLIHSNGSMIRISLYFYLYQTLLLPYGLDHIITKNSQHLAYFLAIGILTVLVLRGGVMNYHFMWQGI